MEERRKKIVELVNEKGHVSFAALVALFPDVSEMTLRKDLKYLDSTRQIVRIYGGARSLDTVISSDAPLERRLAANIAQKREIARKASRLVQPDTAIFLDSGSTATELAKAFADQPCLVFTGGLSCINELSRLAQPEIYVLGGRFNKASMSVHDTRISPDLESVHFSTAFISVHGYSSEHGFTCKSANRWELERAVIKRADQVVVLMDSHKVGIASTFSICMPQDIDVLVSDDGLDPAVRQEMERQGVLVL